MNTIDVNTMRRRCEEFFKDPSAEKVEDLINLTRHSSELDFHLEFHRYLLMKCAGVAEAEKNVRELRQTMAKLTEPPRYPGIVVKVHPRNGAPESAVVSVNGRKMETSVISEAITAALNIGDEVILNRDLNCILECRGYYRGGQLAELDRILPDGRLVMVTQPNTQFIVNAAGCLDPELKPGSQCRYDRESALCFEVIKEKEDEPKNEFPTARFSDVGGLEKEIALVRRAVFWPALYPEKFRRYRLTVPKGVLLTGPPGCGKTLFARALITELCDLYSRNRHTGSIDPRRQFITVKGSELGSMWYSETERAIRKVFQKARDIAQSTGYPTVIFIDELEVLVPIRGSEMSLSVDNRVLQTFLTEMDGLDSCEGKIILIGSTNRADKIDPAMTRPGRMDYIVEILRPNRKAAREIFEIYFKQDIPYSAKGGTTASVIDELIEASLSRIYTQNGADNAIVEVTFRDGTRHRVLGQQLFSGAVARNIVQKACLRAVRREVEAEEFSRYLDDPQQGAHENAGVLWERGDHAGVTVDDMIASIDEEFASMVTMLNRRNIKSYIVLPEDTDVVSVTAAHSPVSANKYIANEVIHR